MVKITNCKCVLEKRGKTVKKLERELGMGGHRKGGKKVINHKHIRECDYNLYAIVFLSQFNPFMNLWQTLMSALDRESKPSKTLLLRVINQITTE